MTDIPTAVVNKEGIVGLYAIPYRTGWTVLDEVDIYARALPILGDVANTQNASTHSAALRKRLSHA
jgi:hypothetical protein